MEQNKIAIRYNNKNVCRLPVIPGYKDKVDVIYGVNYISADYWNMAKEQRMIALKLEEGVIEEVHAEVVKKTIEVKKEKKVKNKDTGKEETKTVTVKEEKSLSVTDFNSLTAKKKENVIKETYKIDTLDAFLETETDPSIRLKLEKRIDKIKNAKTDETIDNPNSHLKG